MRLKRDPRVFKIPPFLSLLCILVGLGWLVLLPLEEYSRRTYISENALLPGQVHTYFGGSEHVVFRAYRHEVEQMAIWKDWPDKISNIFASQGYTPARQKFAYTAAGNETAGENVYAMLKGPRADATEALVLMAPMRNMANEINHSGVALTMTMARYFRRWSLWSKDILFVITDDSIAGPQAWVDAYHDQHPSGVDDLEIKGGALQGAVALDYPAGPAGHRYDRLHVIYDGVNGQLPNLDLVNTLIEIMQGQVGISTSVQQMHNHDGRYEHRLETLLRGLLSQGLGQASGPHSPFMRYHVDAVTLQTVGSGWHDEMALGRVVEGGFRSLNNLLEKLHQSFFLYMLLDARSFVSIGTYLPSAMLVAVNFTIAAIALWIQTGYPNPSEAKKRPAAKQVPSPSFPKEEAAVTATAPQTHLLALETTTTTPRALSIPLLYTFSVYACGLVPLNLLNVMMDDILPFAFLFFATLSLMTPFGIASSLADILAPRRAQTENLILSFSLLVLGVGLSTLATLNFALGLITGILAAPLSFVRPVAPSPGSAPDGAPLRLVKTAALIIATLAVNPISAVVAGAIYLQGDAGFIESLRSLLVQAAFAWSVSGTWTAVILWMVWWPAWVLGCAVAIGRLY